MARRRELLHLGISMLRMRVLIALVLLPLGGCASLTLSAVHNPLYSAVPHTSTITATAVDPKSGVAQIAIAVVDGAISTCGGAAFGLPSVLPCRENARTFTRTCDF